MSHIHTKMAINLGHVNISSYWIAFYANTKSKHLSNTWLSTLEIAASQLSSLTENRADITVLLRGQELNPVWFSCQRQKYPVLLNIAWIDLFVSFFKFSLCTDVPPPSEKIGRRVSSPDFFWRRGDVCTQASFVSSLLVVITIYCFVAK